jgi:hypothetical protein
MNVSEDYDEMVAGEPEDPATFVIPTGRAP